ncbi:DnaD domain-containing protein [Clostridium lacusfryxellense]|uniref:DnaD domain-containing protein n=1 Tax=Clostridium lacusfryxellense TaxID=205328 RepID=UPI001C0BF22C|nr:DnaD domain protein [Clostridium lacusfryxellense]MBU3111038.1 DnaD domain protein [Clostridium lacusfryxellense]
MAKYRQLFTEFWSDSFILELTPDEKLFYVYLISNPKTTQCGIYELSSRIIEIETGLNKETVEKLLHKFCESNKILYCPATKEIMVINWMKYNVPNNINSIKCVNREIARVKNKEFLKILYKKCEFDQLDVTSIFQNIVIEESNDYELHSPSTNNLQAPCKPVTSNRIRSNKEKVMNKKQKLKNKEEVAVVLKPENNFADSSDGLKGVIKVFEENVHAITPLVYKKILEFTKHVSNNVIIMAIDEAVSHQVKTINYISKILNSWIKNGIKTVQQVIAYQIQWANKKTIVPIKSFKPNGFCDYEQRTYDFDLLEKKLLGLPL